MHLRALKEKWVIKIELKFKDLKIFLFDLFGNLKNDDNKNFELKNV